MIVNSISYFVYLYESETWRLTCDPNISNRTEFLEFSPNIIGWQKTEEMEEIEEINVIEECYYE
jgi:hypothetical protein